MISKTMSYKKIGLVLAGLFAAFFLSVPAFAGAQDTHNLCTGADFQFGNDAAPCQTKDKNGNPTDAPSRVGTLVADVVNIVSIIVGVAAVIMIIYAGFRFITSGGNPESTKAARNTILYAIVGLVIVAFAQVIVKFVLGKISGVT